MSSWLFIMAGTKGGIGKTLTASLLADVAWAKGLKTVLYDCDNENESLKNVYTHPADERRVLTINLNGDEVDMDYPLDAVVSDITETENASKNSGGNHVYVVDMKAGTSQYTLDWMKAFPFETIHGMGIEIYLVGCVTADVDSVHTLSRWIYEYLENEYVKFLIIKNLFYGPKLSMYEDTLKESLENGNQKSLVVKLDNLGPKCMKTLKEYHTTLGQVAAKQTVIEKINLVEENRIRTYFNEIVKKLEPIWEIKET